MGPNPYQSPETEAIDSQPARKPRSAGYILAWIICFTTPSLAVAIAQRTPETIWGGLPSDVDSAVTRLSRMIRVRADLPAFIAVVGCMVAASLAPIQRTWKVAIVVATPVLVFIQFFVILLVLVLAGRLS